MATPEGEYPRDRDGNEPSHELEPRPYHRAARFADERDAARAYRRTERAIHRVPCDLSAFRLMIDQVSHVTVVGAPPPPELDVVLAEILTAGEATELPPDVLRVLLARRERASRLGPWVERHYRPGQPL